jgi:hypothetical protein
MATPTVLLATALWAKHVNKLATQTDVRATHTQPLFAAAMRVCAVSKESGFGAERV